MISAMMLFAVTSASSTAPAAQPKMPAWMAGAWTAKLEDGSTWEEHWLKPAGGTMQGTGREVKGDQVTFMEFMSLEQKEGKLIMYMILGAPSGGETKPSPFPATEISDTKIVFDRGGDDFPAKIVYQKVSEKEMLCEISGGAPAIKFNFKRM